MGKDGEFIRACERELSTISLKRKGIGYENLRNRRKTGST